MAPMHSHGGELMTNNAASCMQRSSAYAQASSCYAQNYGHSYYGNMEYLAPPPPPPPPSMGHAQFNGASSMHPSTLNQMASHHPHHMSHAQSLASHHRQQTPGNCLEYNDKTSWKFQVL